MGAKVRNIYERYTRILPQEMREHNFKWRNGFGCDMLNKWRRDRTCIAILPQNRSERLLHFEIDAVFLEKTLEYAEKSLSRSG